MKRLALVLTFGLAGLAIAGSVPALAGPPTRLINKDYAVKGDNLLTYDTVTKLEWLNLTVTKGLSGNEVLSGAGGWVPNGFRYPTADELSLLFLHPGLGSTSDVFLPELYEPARAFLSLIGATRLNEPNGTALYSEAAGLYAFTPNPLGDGMSVAVVSTIVGFDFGNGPENRGYLQHRETYYAPLEAHLPTIGHWLVRDTNKGAGPCR